MTPTYILGLNSFHADSGAALLKDGHLVAAVTEERLNRVKHFAGFPARSIKEVLDIAGIDIRQVDHIGINKDNRANLLAKLAFVASNLTRIPKLARQRLEYRAKAQQAPELICQSLDIAPSELQARIHNVEHHLCHVASSFLVSEFERAAVLSIDGFGDFASTMTALGHGNDIKVLDRTLFPHSMGIVYTMVCQFIGYDAYGDEGKVMGLAPYGDPSYDDFFEQLVRLKSKGRFELNLDYFLHHTEGVDYSFDEQGHPTVAPLFSQAMVRQFGPPRKRHGELTRLRCKNAPNESIFTFSTTFTNRHIALSYVWRAVWRSTRLLMAKSSTTPHSAKSTLSRRPAMTEPLWVLLPLFTIAFLSSRGDLSWTTPTLADSIATKRSKRLSMGLKGLRTKRSRRLTCTDGRLPPLPTARLSAGSKEEWNGDHGRWATALSLPIPAYPT
jgi:hypothetical protein